VKDRDVPDRSARRSRVSWALCAGPALGALFLLVSSTALQNAVANGDTRTLSFEHTHRDDRITVTFKRDGRYDEEGLKQLNHFLRDWRNHEETRMDPQLFDILWEIQREVGTTEAIHIISSYRSPATNSMLRRRSRGVAKFSQHMLGKAIDFKIPGVPIEDLRAAGLRLQRGGVGYYPGSFVHVDVGSVRHWPRMTHDQLARVFPNGKTVHIPSNGQPLKNYELALAEVRRRGSTPSATSLGAAREAGIQTADAGASAGKGRTFLAKLLGIGKDDDEEEGESATPARGHEPASAPRGSDRVELAAVPIPRARPAAAGNGELTVASATSRTASAGEFSLASASSRPAPAGEFGLASASSRPARLSEPAVASPDSASSANDVINARGFWQESDAPPAAREALGSHGERLAWVTGPMGQRIPPRPPADVGTPAAEAPAADTTASVTAWASNPGQNDRVPPDVALAYAAAPAAAAAARPAAAPMGALKPSNPVNTGSATVATRRAAAVHSPAAKIAPRGFDPWLRGLVMTPSVHHSISVAVLGTVDARGLQPLLHKPRSALPMVFSNDPTLGLISLQFTGRAVAFLPTIAVPATRTAVLN
jgi:uncharacterized protein YcbK (DUF882 family)